MDRDQLAWGHRRGPQGGQEVIVHEPTLEEQISMGTEAFVDCWHYEPIWVDLILLEKSVSWMLTTSGWPSILLLTSEADKEDTSEFLATFWYIDRQDHQGIFYRHRGMTYTCNMEHLRNIFQWPANGQVYTPYMRQWNTYMLWRPMVTRREHAYLSASLPVIIYLHKILSKTIITKNNADMVGRSVLYMLKTLKGDPFGALYM